VNKAVWASWSDADQKIVRQAAVEAAAQQIQIARKPLVEDILALGVGVSDLTQEQTAAFVEITKPVYNKWKSRIGAELVNQAEMAVAGAK
jgi:TRAP-type C4-dicarboxylate transport system substrate-binding protein